MRLTMVLAVLGIVLTMLAFQSWSQSPPALPTHEQEIRKKAEEKVEEFLKGLREKQAAAAADQQLCAKSKDPAICEMLAQRLRGIEATLARISSRPVWALWKTVIYSPDIPLPGPQIDPVAEFATLDACETARSTAHGQASQGRIPGEYPLVFHDCHPGTVDPRLASPSPHESRGRR